MSAALAAVWLVPVGAQAEDVDAFTPAYFAEFVPQNAFDMVRRVPGFSINGGDQGRGLAGAQGNVLINGERPPIRGASLEERLRNIRTGDIILIELIEAGERDLDMQGHPALVNLITTERGSARADGEASWEVREDESEAIWYTLNTAFSRSWIEGSLSYDQEDRTEIQYHGYRVPTVDEPYVRRNGDQRIERDRSGIDLLGVLSLPADGRMILSGLFEESTYSEQPYEFLLSGTTESEDNLYDSRTLSVELQQPLSGTLDLTAMLTDQLSNETAAETFIQNGVDSRSASLSESGETAMRATVRWRPFERWTFESGVTAAFNYLEGSSEAFVDGVEQDVDGSDARVEETRLAVLGTVTWSPTSRVTAIFGGRVENFTLNSTTAGEGELSLTDIVPRADVSWTLQNGWVIRGAVERNVGQLNLDDFLADTNLDTAISTAGAAFLEPVRNWVSSLTVERRFDERGLIRLALENTTIDNPIARVPGADNAVRPTNISGEEFNNLRGNLELPLDRWGFAGALFDLEFRVGTSSRIDPLGNFERAAWGFRSREMEYGLRYDRPDSPWVVGFRVTDNGSFGEWRLTETREVFEGPMARVFAEHNTTDRWRSGIWIRMPRERSYDFTVFPEIRLEGVDPILTERRGVEEALAGQVWTEYQLHELAEIRIELRSGLRKDVTSEIFNPAGQSLDYDMRHIDAVPSLTVRLRINR